MVFLTKLKELVSLGSLNILSSVIFGFFWLYLASIMTKEEYGELGFLMSIANVGIAISLLGFRSMVVVYESKNENVFPASFIIVLISANITALFTFVLTQNVFVSILIVGMVLFEIILGGLNGKQRYGDFSKHRIFRALIAVGIALLLYSFLGLNGILLAYLLSTFLILKELNSLIKNKKIDFSSLKSKKTFIAHSFARRMTDVFVKWGDKLLIGTFFGFSMLASYHLAVQFLFLLMVIPQSLAIYLIPKEAKGEHNSKIKIFSLGISGIVAIISFVIIPFGISSFLPKYEESIIAMQILSLGIIPLTITNIQESELFGKENSRVVFLGSILQAGLYLVLIIFLGQIYGLVGFAIGFVLAVIIRGIFNFLLRNTNPRFSE